MRCQTRMSSLLFIAVLFASSTTAIAGQKRDADIRPFTVHVSENALADLRARLANAKWPDQLPGTKWRDGPDLATVRDLSEYWRKEFDWRAEEARINRFAQFVTEIDGQPIHFIHQRSSRADATPLLLLHGWPGSILEFIGLIDDLTSPKDSNLPAFHVVVPSLPGFGLSGVTTSSGWDSERMAKAFVVLMERLGYERYGVQGGDWGSTIARQIAQHAPTHVIGLHLNFLPVPPPDDTAVAQMSPSERSRFIDYWEIGRSSFFKLQSTEPLTVAFGLTDSPVGWLAWLVQKFQDLTDNDGDFLHSVDRDTFVANASLYWLTGTVGSSMRIYREQYLSGAETRLPPLETPIAYAAFPKEVIASPMRWIEHKYRIVQRTEMPKGGHFASWEQPDLLLQDLRRFFASVRKQETRW